MEPILVTIVCDGCGWQKKADPYLWHNKPCPKCSHSPIINDYDLRIFKATEKLIRAGVARQVGPEDKPGPDELHMRIDTSPINTPRHD